jgi:hypothetical protein
MVIRETDTDNFARVMELARALAHHVEDPDPGGSAEGIRIAAGDPHPWFECLVAGVDGGIVDFISFRRRFRSA